MKSNHLESKFFSVNTTTQAKVIDSNRPKCKWTSANLKSNKQAKQKFIFLIQKQRFFLWSKRKNLIWLRKVLRGLNWSSLIIVITSFSIKIKIRDSPSVIRLMLSLWFCKRKSRNLSRRLSQWNSGKQLKVLILKKMGRWDCRSCLIL